MPEAGGAATFVRRAFSDPAGFVTGWVLFLDYLVVIALAALFVPHYLGAAFGWDGWPSGPGTRSSAIAVIAALAALRRVLRGRAALLEGGGRLGRDRPRRAAAAGGARVRAGVLVRLAQRGRRPRHRAVVGLDRPGAVAGDARLHRPRDGHQLRRRGARARAARCRGACSSASAPSWWSTSRCRWSGVSAYPAAPDPSAPDGVASGLGTDWLQAPLVGHRDRPSATSCPAAWPRASRSSSALANALVLVTVDRDRHGRRRAAGLLDGPLRHAAPRLRPPRARRLAHRGGHPRRRGDRRRPPDHLATPWATARSFLAGLYSFGVLIAMTAAQVAVVRLRIREPEPRAALPGAVGRADQGRRRARAVGVGAVLTGGPLGGVAVHPRGRARSPGPIWLAIGVGVYLMSRRAAGETPARPRHAGRARPRGRGAEFGAQRILVPAEARARSARRCWPRRSVSPRRAAPRCTSCTSSRCRCRCRWTRRIRRRRRTGRAALEEAREIAEELGVEVIARVVRARSLAQAILDEAEAVDADLIVLGSAPRWRRQSRFFSPTVDEVLRAGAHRGDGRHLSRGRPRGRGRRIMNS